MKLTRGRWAIGFAIGSSILVAAIVIYIVRLNRSIGGENDRLAASTRVETEEHALRSPSTDGLTLYLDASDVRAVASFEGNRYLATSGGLIALDERDNVRRRFTTLDGLPENDLTALAVFRDKLYVGTASAGLIVFDGVGFTGYRFTNPRATRITVLTRTEC